METTSVEIKIKNQMQNVEGIINQKDSRKTQTLTQEFKSIEQRKKKFTEFYFLTYIIYIAQKLICISICEESVLLY